MTNVGGKMDIPGSQHAQILEGHENLSDVLRERTRSLHIEAERSGILGRLLRGRGTRESYALLLRNLWPAYAAMEKGLLRHCQTPVIGSMGQAWLFRSRAIESDLAALAGPDWSTNLRLLSAGERYEQRVVAAAGGDGTRLIAHAYVRYLGDLSGGQIMDQLLRRSLGLENSMLNFYQFPEVTDLAACKAHLRDAIDRAGREWLDVAAAKAVIEEAEMAFRLNIEVSQAVQAAASEMAGRAGEYS